jgi:predicted RNA-binding Zn-ribbon protein involved in translation (DUF1610 family)
MDDCKHQHLMRFTKRGQRLRCRHCHLTLSSEDLHQRYCPECFEVSGKKRYDFEEVDDAHTASSQYRCEDCGALIQCE